MSSTSTQPQEVEGMMETSDSGKSSLAPTDRPRGIPPADVTYYRGELDLWNTGYHREEHVEFAQLFLSDNKTIFIEDNPRTWPTSEGRWVQGWFMVTKEMVNRYRIAKEGGD